MWFVLILVDKWFLLTVSIPDINRNLAVPAEVLSEKRGCLCSCFLLQPFYQVPTSLFFPRKLTLPGRVAVFVQSSSRSPGLSFIPAIVFMLVHSSHSHFTSLLQPGFFLICWASVYRRRLAVVSVGLTAEVFLVLQPLTSAFQQALSHRIYFSLQLLFVFHHSVCLH